MTKAEITIRAATPEDYELLTRLIEASYAMLGRDGLYDSAQLAAAMPSISKANPTLLASGSYYVAEIDGETAGCGGWSVEKPGSSEIIDGVAHIRHFATHPAHVRKGVARFLLDRCLAEAASAGMHTMKSQSTLLAEPFYASAGFRRVAVAEAKMGGGTTLPVVHMERGLS